MSMATMKIRYPNPLPYLPEDIVFHIFSIASKNITNQEAIRLSLSSKQIFNILQNRPTLIFNLSSHYLYNRQELNYVVSTLSRYYRENIPLETFILKVQTRNEDDDHGHDQLYHQCIELAAKKGLKTLRISFKERASDHVLPQAVFEVDSLVDLQLTNCRLMNPQRVVFWPNLKRLSIDDKCVIEQEEVFENMIMGCPAIENLKVHSHFFTRFFTAKIANLRNLKHLNMMLCVDQRLEVDGRTTPNLESIYCLSTCNIDLGDAEYPNLKSLELKSGAVYEHLFTNFASKFPVLENLSLEMKRITGVEKFSLSSASVKKMKIVINDALLEACFDVPNLAYFKCHKMCCNAFPKFSFTGNSGVWSSCIELTEWKLTRLDASWFLELHKFLAALNESKTSVSVVFSGGVGYVDKAARRVIADSVIRPIHRIKEFSLRSSLVGFADLESCASLIFDCLFLICRPRIIRLVDFMSCELARILHEKLASRSCRPDHGGVIDFEMVEADKNLSDKTFSFSFHLRYYS